MGLREFTPEELASPACRVCRGRGETHGDMLCPIGYLCACVTGPAPEIAEEALHRFREQSPQEKP